MHREVRPLLDAGEGAGIELPPVLPSVFLESIDLVLAAMLSLIVVTLAAQLLWNVRPGRTTCNAPTVRRGRCRNRLREGRPCAAGHTQAWIGGGIALTAVMMALTVALLVFEPLSLLLDEMRA